MRGRQAPPWPLDPAPHGTISDTRKCEWEAPQVLWKSHYGNSMQWNRRSARHGLPEPTEPTATCAEQPPGSVKTDCWPSPTGAAGPEAGLGDACPPAPPAPCDPGRRCWSRVHVEGSGSQDRCSTRRPFGFESTSQEEGRALSQLLPELCRLSSGSWDSREGSPGVHCPLDCPS